MKAGRELDALIATEAMKWELSTNGEVWVDKESGECIRDVDDWRPSDPDGIADAWLVVEKMTKEIDGFNYYWHIETNARGNAIAIYCKGWYASWVGKAPTAPLAICLAALEAVK